MKFLFWVVAVALVYWWKTSLKAVKQMPPKPANRDKAKDMTPAQARKILKVRPEADAAEIKRAYQQLVAQYHPDRVANAAPELQELAERRTKELNLAYATMKRGRNNNT